MKVAGNLFLIGMMGAGKTSIGKLLAKHLSKTFFDSDQEIERRTGVAIPVIFDIEGEEGFRKRESEVLKELAQLNNIVLATGGGAVLKPENRVILTQHGTIIYLRASVEEILARTRHDKTRPLLQTPNKQAKLTELYEERDPLYKEIATITIDTNQQNLHHLISQLEHQLIQLTA